MVEKRKKTKQVDILKTTEDGQEKLGSVLLIDGKIHYVDLPTGIEEAMKRGIVGKNEKIYKPSNGLKFLENLKFQYSGSYLRATDIL